MYYLLFFRNSIESRWKGASIQINKIIMPDKNELIKRARTFDMLFSRYCLKRDFNVIFLVLYRDFGE